MRSSLNLNQSTSTVIIFFNLTLIPFFIKGASVKADEEEFIKVIEGRAKADGKLKVVDVSKKESDIEVKELITLSKVMEGLKEKYPGLTHNRIPVCNSAAPLEPDFDTICNALSGTNVNTPVIVNCQVNCYHFEIKNQIIRN